MIAPSEGQPRVLVIEDDAATGEFLAEIFAAESFQVTVVSQAPSAETVASDRPHLVVLDVLLHGSDGGLRLLRELKRNPETATIPVILCTAHAALVHSEGPTLEALTAGVVLKPFDLDELLATVAAALP